MMMKNLFESAVERVINTSKRIKFLMKAINELGAQVATMNKTVSDLTYAFKIHDTVLRQILNDVDKKPSTHVDELNTDLVVPDTSKDKGKPN